VNLRLRDESEKGAPRDRQPRRRNEAERCDEAADKLAGEAGRHYGGEGAIGRCDQSARKRDALRFKTLENVLRRPAAQHAAELPAEVHRIADTRIHPLTARRAVNVRGVAQNESSSVAKALGDAVMHAIDRKPIDLSHARAEHRFDAAADVVEGQVFGFRKFVGNEADQPLHSARANREEQDQRVFAEVGIKVGFEPLRHRAVTDEKGLLVRDAGEAQAKRFPHLRVRPVAAAEILGHDLFLSVRPHNRRTDTAFILRQSGQRGAPFDGKSRFGESFFEEALVIVLRIG
jgi:hypothetical protein